MKKTHADIVIVGAGIVGASTAYFLARKGWKNIVVLDQGPLFETGGSTSHAPGLIFELNASKTMCQLAQWSVATYRELQEDGEPCFYPVGSIELATSSERWADLKNKGGRALAWGLGAKLLSPQEVCALFPLVNATKICGGLHVPSDGIAKAVRAVSAMARAAQNEGCSFYGQTRVTGFIKEAGRLRGVLTSAGPLTCGQVVLCGGIWGPELGKMLGEPIPLVPVQHQYVHTTQVQALAEETQEIRLPILRHQDRSLYFRQHGQHLGIGSYYHEPLVVNPYTLGAPHSAQPHPAKRAFSEEHFAKAYTSACEILPCLKTTDLGERFNGMFSFTPDGNPLVGESLKLKGLWFAEAVWVTHAAGVGRVVAELLSQETPTVDLRELDCNRFWDHSKSPEYTRLRGAQQYREVYDIIHPLQQMASPRPLRTSPFYPRLLELGAVFFESAGWERPQWFESNHSLAEESAWPQRSGWTAKFWSPIIGKEHKATREKLALFDLTAFTKLEVSGPGALAFLQKLSANQIDVPLGKIVYSSMLNAAGGIQCDLTITRWASDRFWVITGGAIGRHDQAWLLQNLPEHGVNVQDLTSSYCSLGIWGPHARKVLQSLCDDAMSPEAFPFYSAKELYLGSVPCLALRLSYVGELGWEIYTPSEYGLALWDLLWKTGQEYGIIAAGGGAFDSLRLEKGYRLWGADIHTEYHPFEAGLGFAVRMQKENFLGKSALEKIKAAPLERKLCCLCLDNPNFILLGKEPVLKDDHVLGYVTSANYGYTVHESLAYAYLPLAHAELGTDLRILFFGEYYSARVCAEPRYDPSHSRLKS